jgi:hypothetical protein
MVASMRELMRHIVSLCRRYAHGIVTLPERLTTRSHGCWHVLESNLISILAMRALQPYSLAAQLLLSTMICLHALTHSSIHRPS